MFLKAHRRKKDGKDHVYYSLTESVRVNRRRVFQRTILHLGELNTTQIDRWQRSVEVVTEEGANRQMRLFSDREAQAPKEEDVAEVILSSLTLKHPRSFGACWAGCKLWEDLQLDQFWRDALGQERGEVAWEKVVELLVVNRLVAPRSELSIHEKWFPKTAMDILLDCDRSVASKDRLYRALDRMVDQKEALEKHLGQRWRDLFGAKFEVILYDLTSTYFEGTVQDVEKAQRGYSRDHRPDCKQLVLAVVATPEGFPLSYEIFAGNRLDVTTLKEVFDSLERKYGKAERVWVFDRGIVSEENLSVLRERNARYLVGTPRSALKKHEEKLLEKDWSQISGEVSVRLIPEENGETYVLAKSSQRALKEGAMRNSQIRGLMRALVKLRRRIRHGKIKDSSKILITLGEFKNRWPVAWKYVDLDLDSGVLSLRWKWNKTALKSAGARDGAYLLRTNLRESDPAALWRQYTQLTEIEAVFRALKSELAVRPIWHFTPKRVEAHVMVAFLGYCLWVCLKHKLKASAPGLTPWQLLDQLDRIQMIEVWFNLREGGSICLERITQPEPAQAALLSQLNWTLPTQPPPKIFEHQLEMCGRPEVEK